MRAAAILILAACSGDLQEKMGQSNIDGSTLMAIQPPPCDPPATATDGTGDCTGGGKPGDDCLQCHHQGGTGTPFTFAGTVYDATGTTPTGGATVHLEDSVGNVALAIAHATNGNFYGTDFVMYPARAFATQCPDVLAMVAPVDMSTGANCNTAGCHTTGFRIHVP
jgi:hypothetical protein